MNIISTALISFSALWSILQVNSLQCYSCTDMRNNTECNHLPTVTCNSSTSYCFTQVEKIMNYLKITKRCAQSTECDSGNYNVWIASKHTSCCLGNLCNEFANGTNVTYNAFLILAAVLALSIFKDI